MSDGATNLHLAWARLFVRALGSSGVRDVVVSPGSRSTPLVLAIAEDASLRVHVVIDERAAAFFALGQARANGRPSALVCTSGTAAAHYLPAVVEADAAGVPLVVVTADRPWEAHDCGASQTIEQVKLYGGFVRHAVDVAQPDRSRAALRAVQRVAAQAAAASLGTRPGPVHVNLRFRKPLEPVAVATPEPFGPEVEALVEQGPPRVVPAVSEPDPRGIDELAARLASAERGLLVCGPSPAWTTDLRAAATDLARRAGLVVLAEATSQVRFGEPAGAATCAWFDALLRAPGVRAQLAPDVVVELGAPATSSAWAAFAAALGDVPRFVLAPGGHPDPLGSARSILHGDPARALRALAARLGDGARETPWTRAWSRLDEAAGRAVVAEVDGGSFGEGAAVRRFVASLPGGASLAVGNSLPVRHLDTYVTAGGRAIPVLSQRGAAGIDGLVAGAAGSCAASRAPVGLVLGDVSFAHDAAGLATARALEEPLVVLVLDNGGGRIFDQLPIAGAAPEGVLRRFFTTPIELDFEAIARAYGARYADVGDAASLDRALAEAFARRGATVVVARVGGDEAARVARLRAAVAEAAEAALAP